MHACHLLVSVGSIYSTFELLIVYDSLCKILITMIMTLV